jgi:hypothetical protein
MGPPPAQVTRDSLDETTVGDRGRVGADVPAKAKAPSRRGRRPNEKRRTAIQAEIAKFGDEWRDRLSDIFTDLHQANVDMGDLEGREINLGDGKKQRAYSWEDLDLAEGAERRQLIDILRKYA